MDPTTLRHPRTDLSAEEKAGWKYIRVRGLGFLPGVLCPHHDCTQSNGILRSIDFDAMLARAHERTPGEIVGVGIDDQAGIVVDGDRWKVVNVDGTSKVTIKQFAASGQLESVVYEVGSGYHSTQLFECASPAGTGISGGGSVSSSKKRAAAAAAVAADVPNPAPSRIKSAKKK